MLRDGPTRVDTRASPAAAFGGSDAWVWSSTRARCLRGTDAGPVAELRGSDACAAPVLAQSRCWEAATRGPVQRSCSATGLWLVALAGAAARPPALSPIARAEDCLSDHPGPVRPPQSNAWFATEADLARPNRRELQPATRLRASRQSRHRAPSPRRAGTARRRRAGPVTSRRNPRFVRTFPAPATSGEEHEQRSLPHAERSNPQVSGWSKGMPQYACEKAGKCRIPWWARSPGPDGGVSGR